MSNQSSPPPANPQPRACSITRQCARAHTTDMSDAVDVNVKNLGSGAATLLFNRQFEALFRGTDESPFMTAGQFFDLNVYAEDFVSADLFRADRDQFMRASMGTLAEGSIFYAQQADSFVWAVSKLLRDTERLARPLGLSHTQLVNRILPGKRDIPVDVAAAALGTFTSTPIPEAVARHAVDEFVEEMARRVALAGDCVRWVVQCLAISSESSATRAVLTAHLNAPHPSMRYRLGLLVLHAEFPRILGVDLDPPPDPSQEAFSHALEAVARASPRFASGKVSAEVLAMHRKDLELWVFQRISTTASILSDRVPAAVGRSFASASLNAPPEDASPRTVLDLQLLRDYLRHVSASFVPEAYTSRPAVLATVGISQAAMTGVWSARKPLNSPNSPPLPLHALDLATSVLEQVAFTLQHWGDDLAEPGDAAAEMPRPGPVAAERWTAALIGSAKYFARVGEMLLLLDHVQPAGPGELL